uniref:Ovule protein n=1 Tax=Mesocestoides corti TaxID=53468 RepID=A0A5K3G4F0_MESCO
MSSITFSNLANHLCPILQFTIQVVAGYDEVTQPLRVPRLTMTPPDTSSRHHLQSESGMNIFMVIASNDPIQITTTLAYAIII